MCLTSTAGLPVSGHQAPGQRVQRHRETNQPQALQSKKTALLDGIQLGLESNLVLMQLAVHGRSCVEGILGGVPGLQASGALKTESMLSFRAWVQGFEAVCPKLFEVRNQLGRVSQHLAVSSPPCSLLPLCMVKSSMQTLPSRGARSNSSPLIPLPVHSVPAVP